MPDALGPRWLHMLQEARDAMVDANAQASALSVDAANALAGHGHAVRVPQVVEHLNRRLQRWQRLRAVAGAAA
jgi:hypothetical protein